MAISPRQQQIAANAATLDKQFQGENSGAPGGDWGGAYIRYMAMHPGSDPDTIFNAVENQLAGAQKDLNALPKSIAAAVGAVGQTVGGTFPNAVAKGADVLGGLNLGSLMVRVGEVLLGIVLIGVGIAKLTGTSNVISQAAKVAAVA